MTDYQEKYNKYKSKYIQLKNYLGTFKHEFSSDSEYNFIMNGGTKQKKEKSINHTEQNVLGIDCIEIHQNEKDKMFKGVMCKSPSIKIRFKTDTIKLAYLVKSCMRLVNKSLPMKSVKKVEITIDKDVQSYDGDKLSEDFNINKKNSITKIIIHL